jgi:hypothetical protein
LGDFSRRGDTTSSSEQVQVEEECTDEEVAEGQQMVAVEDEEAV